MKKNRAVQYHPNPDALRRYGYGNVEGNINLYFAIGLVLSVAAIIWNALYHI